MSCYEWEAGRIKFSAKEWVPFRKEMMTEWVTRQERLYVHAAKVTETMKQEVKGARGPARSTILANTMAAYARKYALPLSVALEVERAVLDFNWDTQGFQLAHPKFSKKTFGLPCSSSRGGTIQREDWTMTFDDAQRELIWEVSENNHAVDRARSHDFVHVVFDRLRHVKWTRGTGGVIVGNDEYSRDTDCVGGGGNYITGSYGPRGAKAHGTSSHYLTRT